jgi:hypothetical protein
MVTWLAEDNFSANLGDVVDITGTTDEFNGGAAGSETRVQASSVSSTGATAQVQALSLSDASVLTSEATGEEYEGLIVTIAGTTVESSCLGFGQQLLANGVITDDVIYNDDLAPGMTIDSLTGAVGYNAFADGGFRLYPRDAGDIVSSGIDAQAVPINQIRDPNHASYIAECEFGCSCAPVKLENMVVVGDAVVADEDDDGNPYLFGFYVMDPTLVDGSGNLQPWSGIHVTVAPGAPNASITGYTFGGTGGDTFPEPWDVDYVGFPQHGDVITVIGTSGAYFDMAQLTDVSMLSKNGTAGDGTTGVTMPSPATFDGTVAAGSANHPDQIKTGRPTGNVPSDYPGDPAPGPMVEAYEGVWVRLENVSTIDECIGSDYQGYFRDFGYFLVTGGVEIGTQWRHWFEGSWYTTPADIDATDQTCANLANKCEDSRALTNDFDSIEGVINYSFEVHRLNPLGQEQIQPQTLYVADGTGNCQ